MKNAWKRWAWPLAKALFGVVLLVVIGRKFYVDLRDLDTTQLELRPGWLALSGVLYVGGLLTSAWYWHHLLCVFDQRPRWLQTLRGYFMGHLGKYVPGKAWALILRGTYVRDPNTRFGVAIIASFYEVLTTMAAGGLVAALIFAIEPPDDIPGLAGHPLLATLLMLALCGVPLLPGVFNFLVGRMARRFENMESFRLPRLRVGTLFVGLAVTGAGWLSIGLSVLVLLHGMLHEPPEWSLVVWLRCTAGIGLAYVAGFLIVFVPAGLGTREYFLKYLLTFASPSGAVIDAAVLMLRLVWTAVEVLVAAVLVGMRSSFSPACGTASATPQAATPQAANPQAANPQAGERVL